MGISKRLRFEILRRDEHKCRYCGRSAADGPLTVDHVKAKALGGSDDPTNLASACSDCNSGKSSVSVDAPLVDGVAQDALRWSRAARAAEFTGYYAHAIGTARCLGRVTDKLSDDLIGTGGL